MVFVSSPTSIAYEVILRTRVPPFLFTSFISIEEERVSPSGRFLTLTMMSRAFCSAAKINDAESNVAMKNFFILFLLSTNSFFSKDMELFD